MTFKAGDLVRLKGERRDWVVLTVFQSPFVSYAEAMVELAGDYWSRPTKLVPVADLTLIVDLEDLD